MVIKFNTVSRKQAYGRIASKTKQILEKVYFYITEEQKKTEKEKKITTKKH